MPTNVKLTTQPKWPCKLKGGSECWGGGHDMFSDLFDQHAADYFPSDLKLEEVGNRMLKPSKPNGGWGDPRDHELCLLNTHPLEPITPPLASPNRTEVVRRLLNFKFGSISHEP